LGKRAKVVNVVVNTFGNYLGMEKGCIVLRDKNKSEHRYPLFEAEIGEVVLTSGNAVSTGALTALGFWGIDVLIATRNGRPIAMLKNLEDDAHVKTRIKQYEALNNGKGIDVAKQIVYAKIFGQNQILKKYGLRQYDLLSIKERIAQVVTVNPTLFRKQLCDVEAKCSRIYFNQIFTLFPFDLKPDNRRTFQAYDGINNLFNLAYELLFWKCYRALSKVHLEPHLGFVHVLNVGRPSLVCDFEELYRYLIDDLVIDYGRKLSANDFVAKTETFNGKKGKRIYLNKKRNEQFLHNLHAYFQTKLEIPRIMHGDKQEIETLISEEALLLAKYFRGEKPRWIPRIADLQ
jgi:CRISP-associated protein Cas1